MSETVKELLTPARKGIGLLSKRLRMAWNVFLKDEFCQLLFGIYTAMFGAIINNSLVVGFGLGMTFASTIAIYGRRRKR